MNKQFVAKMMQAKKMQYQEFKEIMPEPMAKRIASLENELVEIGKEYFMSASVEGESGHQEDDSKNDSKKNFKAHKVTIE